VSQGPTATPRVLDADQPLLQALKPLIKPLAQLFPG
jgi:hypothetical protein